jgi:hypothetical protein
LMKLLQLIDQLQVTRMWRWRTTAGAPARPRGRRRWLGWSHGRTYTLARRRFPRGSQPPAAAAVRSEAASPWPSCCCFPCLVWFDRVVCRSWIGDERAGVINSWSFEFLYRFKSHRSIIYRMSLRSTITPTVHNYLHFRFGQSQILYSLNQKRLLNNLIELSTKLY